MLDGGGTLGGRLSWGDGVPFLGTLGVHDLIKGAVPLELYESNSRMMSTRVTVIGWRKVAYIGGSFALLCTLELGLPGEGLLVETCFSVMGHLYNKVRMSLSTYTQAMERMKTQTLTSFSAFCAFWTATLWAWSAAFSF